MIKESPCHTCKKKSCFGKECRKFSEWFDEVWLIVTNSLKRKDEPSEV